jgi:hypothetical protein
MKTTIHKWSRLQAGHSILLVMIISTATFLVLGGLLKWSVGNTTANVRNNQYFKTVAAAEGATEKVIANLVTDYFEDEAISSNLERYRALVPTAAESARWGNYVFSDGEGNINRTYVEHLPPDEFRVLDSQYRGLHGYASAFRVISNARELNTPFPMTAALRQDVEVAMIPLFQFAIFYNLDLEINPGPPMVVTGPVHCNKTIYMRPGDELRFKSDVTAVGALQLNRHPDDPTPPGSGRVIFEAEHDAGVPSLNLAHRHEQHSCRRPADRRGSTSFRVARLIDGQAALLQQSRPDTAGSRHGDPGVQRRGIWLSNQYSHQRNQIVFYQCHLLRPTRGQNREGVAD